MQATCRASGPHAKASFSGGRHKDLHRVNPIHGCSRNKFRRSLPTAVRHQSLELDPFLSSARDMNTIPTPPNLSGRPKGGRSLELFQEWQMRVAEDGLFSATGSFKVEA